VPLNTTPRTWVTGELLTATLLNVELRDALTNLQAAWTAWTPSPALTSSGTNPTMGNSTVVGATHQIGKTILWRLRITLGSTFAAGTGTYFLALPFSIGGILSNEDLIGYGQVLAGGTRRAVQVYAQTATTGFMVRTSSEADLTSSGPGVAWAAGQVISLTGVYQSA
jgi:hypothetical protein